MIRLPEWRTRAACRGRLDLDFIDPPPDQVTECRTLCARCPVLDQCRAEALTSGEAWGIWGGLDADEREQVAERDGYPPPAVRPPHGTNPRYAKHGCRCTLCRHAHTDYERERRTRARSKSSLAIWATPHVLTNASGTGRRRAWPGQLVLPLQAFLTAG